MDRIHLIIQSIFAFCIVSVDEFIVLLLFFTKAIAAHHSSYHRIQQQYTWDEDNYFEDINHVDQLTVFQIISGQIIGFTIIIGISLFGSLFGFFIPYDYLALLGIFPLVLGLYELYKVVNYWRKRWLIYYSRKNSTNALNAYQEVPNAMSSPYLRHDQRYQYIAQRKQSGSYNPSPTDRIRAQGDQKGLSDFELQYEMISSLSYRLNHPQHTKGDKDNYYPRNHDYSSYQNPSPPLPSPLAPILHPESTDAIDSGGNEVEEEDEIKVTHLPLKDENRRTARPIPSSISLLSDTSDDDVMNYYNNKGEDDYRSGTSSDEEEKIESTILTRWFEQYFQPLLHRNIFYVSLVLLLDGSEEIAVFLPFLSTISQQQHESSVVIHHQHHHADKPLTVWQKTGTLFVIIIVWYLLILCQCYFAYLLIIYHSESYGKWISRYSKNVIPLVLIGLGVIILRDSIIGKLFISQF